MSTLWTPSGEHRPRGEESTPATPAAGAPGPGGGGVGAPDDAELRAARAELAAIPVVDIVANHAIGLWQLAVLHLTPDPAPDGTPVPPRLAEAQLVIDALGGLVEGLGDRLAPHDEALREALAQLRLAFVQVSQSAD